jgi:hypothetical protein
MSRLLLLTLMMIVLPIVGCSSAPQFDPRTAPPPIAASELIRVHNERVEPLDKLWARVSVRAEGRDPRGDKFREQGEGHLQIVRPDRFSLTIGKFEETYFALGANGEQYWSIDLSRAENKVAMIGQQSLATPDKLASLGLPIHPHEMIMLLGVLPIDSSLELDSYWSPDGENVGIEVPADWGSVAFWFDAKTTELARTQAFDADGELVASAKLWRYKAVEGLDDPDAESTAPGVVELRAVGFDGLVRMEISGPRSRAIRSVVFRPENLTRIYRVHEIIDLDAPQSTPDP